MVTVLHNLSTIVRKHVKLLAKKRQICSENISNLEGLDRRLYAIVKIT